jgi:hypothetical protein
VFEVVIWLFQPTGQSQSVILSCASPPPFLLYYSEFMVLLMVDK